MCALNTTIRRNKDQELAILYARLAHLEAENAALRHENATLQAANTLDGDDLLIFEALTHAPAATYLYDWVNGRNIYANQGMSELLGYPLHTYRTAPKDFIINLIHPDDRHHLADHSRFLCQQSGKVVSHTLLRVQRADNEWRWVILSERVLRHQPDGSPRVTVGTMTDVTERHAALAALRESENRHRAVVETIHEGVLLIDAEGTIFGCNSSAERILSLPRMTMLGKSVFTERWMLIDTDHTPIPISRYPACVALETGEPLVDIEVGFYTPDNRLVWLLLNSTPLRDGDPHTLRGVVVSFSDITALHNARAELHRERAFLQAILQHAPLDIWVQDLHGQFLLVNQHFCDRLGMPTDEVLYSNPAELLVTDELEQSTRYDSDVVTTQQPTTYELVHNTAQGVRVLLQTRFPLFDQSGQVYALGGVAADITVQKELEQAWRQLHAQLSSDYAEQGTELMRQRALLQSILTHAPLSIIVKDTEQRILLLNEYTADILSVDAQQVIGRYEHDIFDPEQAAYWRHIDERVLATGKPVTVEETAPVRDELRTFLSTTFPIFSTGGDIIALGVISTDITERKRYEAALQASEQRHREILTVVTDLYFSFTVGSDGSLTPEWLSERIASDRTYRVGEPLTDKEVLFAAIAPDDQLKARQILRRVLAGYPDMQEIRIRYPGGQYRWMRTIAHPVWGAHERRVVRIYGAAQDITERKEAEHLMTRYTERNMELREIDQLLMVVSTPDELCTYMLPLLRRLINCTWLGLWLDNNTFYTLDHHDTPFQICPWYSGIQPCTTPTAHAAHALEDLLDGMGLVADTYILSVPLLHGHTHLGMLLLAPATADAMEEDTLLEVQQVVRQMASALHKIYLFHELESSRERLRDLTRTSTRLQEQERTYLSRELHDEAGQSLTALSISLQLLRDDLPNNIAHLRRIDDMLALLTETLERLRALARDLRPPALDTLGLADALEDMCHRMVRHTTLNVSFTGQEPATLSEEATIGLYRLAQEALTNVVRHAEAHHVWITLNQDDDTTSITIEDDGKGIPHEYLAQPNVGVGLIGMRERIELLGGTLEIDSAPGQGTRIVGSIRHDDQYGISS